MGTNHDAAMHQLQEMEFGKGYDYRIGSPHLRHWKLYDGLTSELRNLVHSLAQTGAPLRVLEIGAGHGGYTEVALAMGCRVTATEMSRASLDRLRDRFFLNRNFSASFDPDGSLEVLAGERFSLILAASVLHHIPDYLRLAARAIDEHLLAGGAFLSLQDPLWYPTLPRGTRYTERIAYVSWRIFRGNLGVGAKTLGRRLRHTYDEENPSDMVEYHVVRQGVNQDALGDLLRPQFERYSLITYWSTQAPLWQLVGDRLGLRNTFAIRAEGFTPPGAGPQVSSTKLTGSTSIT